MISLLQIAMIKLPEKPTNLTAMDFISLVIILLISIAIVTYLIKTFSVNSFIEPNAGMMDSMLGLIMPTLIIVFIIVEIIVIIIGIHTNLTYSANIMDYEIKQEEYQTELSKYSKMLIMNKYIDNERYILVLDDSKNTEIEVTKGMYNQAALGQPLGRYIESIKG